MPNELLTPKQFSQAILDGIRKSVAGMPEDVARKFALLDPPGVSGFNSGLLALTILAARERVAGLPAVQPK
jgi:hypothetical protein